MLRHSLATLAYRLDRAVEGAPVEFGTFRAGTARTPVEILAHISDLMDWALRQADGVADWTEAAPQSWEAELTRFSSALGRLDARLAAGPVLCEEKRLFQGPIADALTHVGQIALLRRLQGTPARPKNYFKAEI
jgi:hypothetical protein